MPFVLNRAHQVKISRTDGRITHGFFQGRVKGRDDRVVVAWTDEQGCDVGKIVLIKEFVELNPQYAYLLPQPAVIPITFSQEQVAAFQQCTDCPECFKNQ